MDWALAHFLEQVKGGEFQNTTTHRSSSTGRIDKKGKKGSTK
jgi:hypothetical protein